MNIGISTKIYRLWTAKWFFSFYVPILKIGFFKNIDDNDSRWIGVQLDLKTELSYELYDYGKTFIFIICGFGIDITKTCL